MKIAQRALHPLYNAGLRRTVPSRASTASRFGLSFRAATLPSPSSRQPRTGLTGATRIHGTHCTGLRTVWVILPPVLQRLPWMVRLLPPPSRLPAIPSCRFLVRILVLVTRADRPPPPGLVGSSIRPIPVVKPSLADGCWLTHTTTVGSAAFGLTRAGTATTGWTFSTGAVLHTITGPFDLAPPRTVRFRLTPPAAAWDSALPSWVPLPSLCLRACRSIGFGSG